MDERIPTDAQARCLMYYSPDIDTLTECIAAGWIRVTEEADIVTDAGRAALKRWEEQR